MNISQAMQREREKERERESCLSQAGVETNMEADTSIMYIRRMRPCKR